MCRKPSLYSGFSFVNVIHLCMTSCILSPESASPIIRISDGGLLIRILAHLHHLLHWGAGGGGVPAFAHQYLLTKVEIRSFGSLKHNASVNVFSVSPLHPSPLPPAATVIALKKKNSK
jgi:hypothetical protein